MPAVSGHQSRITINGQFVYRAYRWSVDWKCDDYDTTTFENMDMGTYTPGIYDYTITFDGFWDTTISPFADEFALRPGRDLRTNTTVSVRIQYAKGNQTVAQFMFPTVLIVDARAEAAVRDAHRLSFTGKATGYDANTGTSGNAQAGLIHPFNA